MHDHAPLRFSDMLLRQRERHRSRLKHVVARQRRTRIPMQAGLTQRTATRLLFANSENVANHASALFGRDAPSWAMRARDLTSTAGPPVAEASVRLR